MFLLLGIGVQFYMLHLLSREENVLNIFAGQPHLCNFGQGVRGPSGSLVTPPRTYDFSQWSMRSFARDSLKAVFPHRADEINSSMDAGEYALESFAARWACCFVFMVATFQELLYVLRTFWMLLFIPTADEPWIGSRNSSNDVAMTPDMTLPDEGGRAVGLTPLMYTAQNGAELACMLLLEAKACVNAEDEDALTPLHFAASAGSLATCRVLLDHRADVCAKDAMDRTALDMVPPGEMFMSYGKEVWKTLLAPEEDIGSGDLHVGSI